MIEHGGKRQGAGRKSSEASVRISVPVGILDSVNSLIAAYKQGNVPVIQEQPNFIDFQVPSLGDDRPAIDSQEKAAIIAARKELERFAPSRLKKEIIKIHGSLFNAARDGVRVKPDKKGISFPPNFIGRYVKQQYKSGASIQQALDNIKAV